MHDYTIGARKMGGIELIDIYTRDTDGLGGPDLGRTYFVFVQGLQLPIHHVLHHLEKGDHHDQQRPLWRDQHHRVHRVGDLNLDSVHHGEAFEERQGEV